MKFLGSKFADLFRRTPQTCLSTSTLIQVHIHSRITRPGSLLQDQDYSSQEQDTRPGSLLEDQDYSSQQQDTDQSGHSTELQRTGDCKTNQTPCPKPVLQF